ncbi:triadin-like [Lampris incognitus]|uniref:triadin-like n=1 Tax=Lampris incognitus TaxID=2546036 RepID=UPI0024B57D4E|nr:triadin-like [Lampris incognitus]
MTEAVEVRSSTTTTMVIDSKSGDAGSPPARLSRKTFTDDIYSTFSSPLAWILVLALVITWSCVFVIMFDLMDYRTLSGAPPPPAVRKALKETGRRGGLYKISSDPMKVVNEAMDESSNLVSMMLNFAASLIAPEEDEGNLYAVRKKGSYRHVSSPVPMFKGLIKDLQLNHKIIP